MFGFLKKFFGAKPTVNPCEQAPYKVEAPVNPQITDSVTSANPLDVNKDGKVNLDDAKEAVKKTTSRVKKAADVDGDGKVTVKDAKAAVKKAAPKRGRKPKNK